MNMTIGTDPAQAACGMFDDEVREQVLRELRHSNWTRHVQIEVEVNNGAVTLHGTVPSCAIRDAAERVVGQVVGVRSIVNTLVVALP